MWSYNNLLLTNIVHQYVSIFSNIIYFVFIIERVNVIAILRHIWNLNDIFKSIMKRMIIYPNLKIVLIGLIFIMMLKMYSSFQRR